MRYSLIIAEKPDMARAFVAHLYPNKDYKKEASHFISNDGSTVVTWA